MRFNQEKWVPLLKAVNFDSSFAMVTSFASRYKIADTSPIRNFNWKVYGKLYDVLFAWFIQFVQFYIQESHVRETYSAARTAFY